MQRDEQGSEIPMLQNSTRSCDPARCNTQSLTVSKPRCALFSSNLIILFRHRDIATCGVTAGPEFCWQRQHHRPLPYQLVQFASAAACLACPLEYIFATLLPSEPSRNIISSFHGTSKNPESLLPTCATGLGETSSSSPECPVVVASPPADLTGERTSLHTGRKRSQCQAA